MSYGHKLKAAKNIVWPVNPAIWPVFGSTWPVNSNDQPVNVIFTC
jgi:hypothetical protein